MKQKKISVSKQKSPLPVSVASMRLSTDTFYGIFLSLAFVVTGLLLGANRGVTALVIQSHIPEGNVQQMAFEHRVRKLVTGYPIEVMSGLISEQNKITASFLVGIAKKESNWGKRVPRAEDGSDCYNYWGYRGAGSRGIAMGHGCFGSPEEAIGVVGGRLDTFRQEYKFTTPEELIVWKCGFSCDGHSKQSVKKWIADVGYYSRKVE
jgi:hypothetical protein